MKSKIIALLLFSGIMFILPCNAQFKDYGLLGKKTVDRLSNDINNLKKDVLIYLSDSLNKTINKSVLSILDSAINTLGNPKKQQGINKLIDGLIKNSVGSTRQELIIFKDSLLDDKFRAQLSKTLNLVMNDVVEKPATRMLDLVTGDETRNHLDKLLRMIVPALLNDTALNKVDHLRNALLGDGMKKDISGIVDTALGTVNSRLKGELKQNIHDIVDQNSKSVGVQVKDILLYAGLVVLILGLVFYYFHAREVKKKNDLLFTLSNTIEEFREEDGTPDQQNFHKLTDMIRKNMVRMQLENDMKNFLIKKSINKPTDYTR